jgi:hypothetical protein
MMCYYIRLLRLIEERITIGYCGGCMELIMRHWKIVLTWDGWKERYSSEMCERIAISSRIFLRGFRQRKKEE